MTLEKEHSAFSIEKLLLIHVMLNIRKQSASALGNKTNTSESMEREKFEWIVNFSIYILLKNISSKRISNGVGMWNQYIGCLCYLFTLFSSFLCVSDFCCWRSFDHDKIPTKQLTESQIILNSKSRWYCGALQWLLTI